ATESECNWLVSSARSTSASPYYCFAADALYRTDIDPNGIYNAGFLNAHRGRIVNLGLTGGDGGVVANYLIIATRATTQPTSARHESWGQVKARYRSTPGMTVTPGADNR